MSRVKSSLMKSVLGFFLAAMCIIYNQQIGVLAAKALLVFGETFSKIVTPIFLKALGI